MGGLVAQRMAAEHPRPRLKPDVDGAFATLKAMPPPRHCGATTWPACTILSIQRSRGFPAKLAERVRAGASSRTWLWKVCSPGACLASKNACDADEDRLLVAGDHRTRRCWYGATGTPSRAERSRSSSCGRFCAARLSIYAGAGHAPHWKILGGSLASSWP